jgi:hypothetical protein
MALIATALLAIAGCGGEAATSTDDADEGTASESSEPPQLADQPGRQGEIVIEGVTPGSYGPFSASGPYTLRFEQSEPPSDTRGALVVATATEPGGRPIDVLINTTDRRGRYPVYLNGKFFVDVSVAGAAYVVRLAPL